MTKSTNTNAPNVVTPLHPDRRLPTKDLLIETAERLFGQRGFDGVSLREIAVEAGQSNANVVQYHYGDKAGLISAILENRVARIETLRTMQLAMLDKNVPASPRQLFKILWLPLMSVTDASGGHSFCRFMMQYLLHPKLASHPLALVDKYPFKVETEEEKLASGQKAMQKLFTTYSDLPEKLVARRISTLAVMFLASVVEHDNNNTNNTDNNNNAMPEPYDIEPIINMAIAALSAPR